MSGIEIKKLFGTISCKSCQGEGLLIHPKWMEWTEKYKDNLEEGKKNFPIDILGNTPQYFGCSSCDATGIIEAAVGLEIEFETGVIELRESDQGVSVWFSSKDGCRLVHTHSKSKAFFTQTGQMLCHFQKEKCANPIEDEGLEIE